MTARKATRHNRGRMLLFFTDAPFSHKKSVEPSYRSIDLSPQGIVLPKVQAHRHRNASRRHYAFFVLIRIKLGAYRSPMRVPPFRVEFLVAKKPLLDRVHPFQFLKSILDRCDCPYKPINVVHDDMSAQIARLFLDSNRMDVPLPAGSRSALLAWNIPEGFRPQCATRD